jgi:hypothetical protein
MCVTHCKGGTVLETALTYEWVLSKDGSVVLIRFISLPTYTQTHTHTPHEGIGCAERRGESGRNVGRGSNHAGAAEAGAPETTAEEEEGQGTAEGGWGGWHG